MRLVRDGLGFRLYAEPSQVTGRLAVCTARKYLRGMGFLHYSSQLVPERLGSEAWATAWAYIREIDDVVDRPGLTRDQALSILEGEWEVVERCLEGSYEFRPGDPIRYLWLKRFIELEEEHYGGSARPLIRELYESAVMDALRKGRVLSRRELRRLLERKAVAFFRLYFTISELDLGPYRDEIAEALGLALGMLDDALDLAYDLRSGYINVSREDLEELELVAHVRDRGFVRELVRRGYYHALGVDILRLLLRARSLAWRLRSRLVRNFVLRLTEAFAAPVLEGRFAPGGRYFFKGGRLLLRLLPRDEEVAYRIGHRLVSAALSVPQLPSFLVRAWLRMVRREGGT